MLSRNDQITITSVEWKRGRDSLYWYTVRTDATGEHEFHVRGVKHLPEMAHEEDLLRAEGWVVGGTITLGQLHKVPLTRGLWAMIEPGVHILMGQMVDGLESLCGPLAYAHFADVAGIGYQPTAEQMGVAHRAAETLAQQGKDTARHILEESKLFRGVYDRSEYIAGGGPCWGDPDVWEVR